MRTDYFIRQATKADANTVASMWAAIDALIVDPPFGGTQPNHIAHQQQIIERTIDAPQGNVWMSCWQGNDVGTISAHIFERPQVRQSHIGVIYGLWVEPEHRRNGIASALLETVRLYCHSQSVDALQVAWDHCNKDAAAFWQKQGFAPYEVIASQSLNL